MTNESQVREAFFAWVRDQGCDTDGAWSAWSAAHGHYSQQIAVLREALEQAAVALDAAWCIAGADAARLALNSTKEKE